VVVGGLVSSLALSLFLLPMLYRLFPPPVRLDTEIQEPLLEPDVHAPGSARAEGLT